MQYRIMKTQTENNTSTRTRRVYNIARDTSWQKERGLLQNNYIAEVEEVVNQKNESLGYASFLQNALIPGKDKLPKIFPHSFVYHSPKEIVSGDFCWLEQVGDIVFVAAADCTGHGVPGALMTIVCSTILTKTVKELGITTPGKILDKVRELVIDSFNGSGTDIKDGMDISLCAINIKTLKIEWSGAHNPLLYFHENEMHELLGDRQPIGKHEKYVPFITHTVQLCKEDTIYMFTDGYADQFGGEKGKKLMHKQLKQILTTVAQVEITTQKNLLTKVFEEWKGNLEQIDDVMVIGIKL
jgi:serine phosphatase RsbU (regulator of sigma subunit)